MALPPTCYAEDFADHVGGLEYHGLDVCEVDCVLPREQVAEGDRVASRFVLSGTDRGREVRLWGIVISRLRDGRGVED